MYVINATIEESLEGTYYFKNGKYGNYMQPNNANPSIEGALLELWKYDGTSVQRWNIEYVGNGYYKIVSADSGKAVTAPSSVDGNLTQTTYSDAENQQWRIITTESGMYKLSPRSSLTNYMAAGEGIISAEDRNVQMRAERDDHKDEWYITDKRLYLATVNNYFDYGYTIYYEETSNESIDKIREYLQEISDRFYDILGLRLICADATYYASPID